MITTDDRAEEIRAWVQAGWMREGEERVRSEERRKEKRKNGKRNAREASSLCDAVKSSFVLRCSFDFLHERGSFFLNEFSSDTGKRRDTR